jgi:ATP-dependent RNA helicase RhlE
MTFDDLEIAEPILRAVREKGYNEPTPIQQQAIPVVTRGNDIFGIAQTGTGKTAAFAIPIIQSLWKDKLRRAAEAGAEDPAKEVAEAAKRDSANGENQSRSARRRRDRRGRNHGKPQEQRIIRALVITPTRELALQIDECFADYGKYTGLRHAAIFGGVKQGPQTEKLRRGIDILIATPGRLLDLMGQGEVHLDGLHVLVLDEADRMLDMGFIPDIRRLLTKIPTRRQTLFFSATMPDPIVSLSRGMLNNPVRIEVTPASSTVDTVDQSIYFVEKPDKKALLVEVLKRDREKTVLIFSRTKHGADNISKILQKAGIDSAAIHGDKSQGQRQRALTDFKSGRVKVLVATDIAARGLDIKELGMVINFDLPDVVETYVHRIGRTGRAGAAGEAITFCSQDDHMMVKDIQNLVGRPIHMELF